MHFCEQYINPKPRLGHPAILLFPEFDDKTCKNHGSADFLTLRLNEFMKKHDMEPFVFQVTYKSGCLWEEQIPHIRQQCLQIQQVTEQNQIYFVAHSLGGILAMIVAVFEAPLYNIDIPLVMTIATPLQDCRLLKIVQGNLLPIFPRPKHFTSIGCTENEWVSDLYCSVKVVDSRHSMLLVSEKICRAIEDELKQCLFYMDR